MNNFYRSSKKIFWKAARSVTCFVVFTTPVFSTEVFASEKVSLVTISTVGWGNQKSDAVRAALSEAVAQVTGRSIEARNSLRSNSREMTTNTSSQYAGEKEISQEFDEAFRGVVDSYEITDMVRSGSGWEASVEAKVARLTPGETKRKPLAVIPFTTSSNPAVVFDQQFDGVEAARLLSQSLVDKLTGSRRFLVVDREHLQAAQDEAELVVNNPMVSLARVAEVANVVAAEYIVVGQLESLKVASESRKLPGLDRKVNLRSATVSVSHRVLDVASRQVKYAGTEVFTFSTEEILDSGDLMAVVTRLLDSVAEQLAEKMLDAIYPVLLTAVTDDRVTLNRGGDTVKQGSVYDLYRYGEKMFDPYTRESLGREEIYVGTVSVTDVRPKISLGILSDTEEDLEAGFTPRKYVLRLRSWSNDARQDRSNRHTEASKIIEEKRVRNDKDW